MLQHDDFSKTLFSLLMKFPVWIVLLKPVVKRY